MNHPALPATHDRYQYPEPPPIALALGTMNHLAHTLAAEECIGNWPARWVLGQGQFTVGPGPIVTWPANDAGAEYDDDTIAQLLGGIWG